MSGVNTTLMGLAQWRLEKDASSLEKVAVTGPGGGAPPAGGGTPPMDPSAGAGGGAPAPGGMPPGGGMDPASMGMPTMANPAPPMPAPMPGQPMPGQPAPGGAAGGGKSNKVDPAEISRQLYNANVMLSMLLNHAGIEIPADRLLGPPPGAQADPTAGLVMGQQMPQGGAGGAGGGQPPGGIAPIDPMAGGAPAGGAPPAGGMGKTSGLRAQTLGEAFASSGAPVIEQASAIAALYRSLGEE